MTCEYCLKAMWGVRRMSVDEKVLMLMVEGNLVGGKEESKS